MGELEIGGDRGGGKGSRHGSRELVTKQARPTGKDVVRRKGGPVGRCPWSLGRRRESRRVRCGLNMVERLVQGSRAAHSHTLVRKAVGLFRLC